MAQTSDSSGTSGLTCFVTTGAESCGKSTLAAALAVHLGAPLVPEAARDYLQQPNYTPRDLLNIARRQRSLEHRAAGTANEQGSLFICDTDLQVLYIWWQEKYGPVPSCLVEAYAAQSSRHYFLCLPDLMWEADPLREHPEERERLTALYEADLQARGASYTRLGGSEAERLALALRVINSITAGDDARR